MYKVIDLFCWVGGFSKWFMYEDFDVVLWVDKWDVALETFETSHKNTLTKLADLTEIPNSFWEKYVWINVIIAWPPCQGFSMAWKRQSWDVRNSLFWEVIRASKIIGPDVVIIENVVGLLSMKDKNWNFVKDIIKKELSALWYIVQYKVLDASNYWVPQKRKRVIFVGTRNEWYSYPTEDDSVVTVWDALSNIPDSWEDTYLEVKNEFQALMSKYTADNTIYNHDAIKHKSLIVERMSHVPQWWNWKDIPKKLWQWWWVHSNNYRRLDSNQPSITLKHATKSMIIHPTYNRCLTPREVARLQSFSDDFVLKWSKFEQHQQLANAVPPLLWKAIAKSVKLYLNQNVND